MYEALFFVIGLIIGGMAGVLTMCIIQINHNEKEDIWGEEYFEKDNNTVMAHIARLRDKMHEPARKPKYIKTVWGVGYTIG